MPEFRYIRLGEDVVAASLQEARQAAWLIYPTQRSCREAQKLFQQAWQPLEISFFSMEEFKQQLIWSERICLQDEKRLVCLYQAMTPEDRAAFHIAKYPDLIDWGQHFFQFLEELAEEGIDAEHILARMQGNEFSYQEWQLENYRRLLKIRSQYRDFITAKGYTDAIFDNNLDNLHPPAGVQRFVFVNQFYYTGLEKGLLARLEALRKEVIVLFQGDKDWLDEASLKSRDFTLEEAFPNGVPAFTLKAFWSGNPWQMALGFLGGPSGQGRTDPEEHLIVDAGFLRQPYHKAFPREVFQYSEALPLHNTRLFHFFQTMAGGLGSLVSADGRKLVQLDWLLQAVGMEGFISYFRPDWDAAQTDAFIGYVCSFSERDILYLDLKLELLKLLKQEAEHSACETLLREIITLMTKLSGLRSIKDFLACIDSEGGLYPERLLSDAEKSGSDLRERWYEALANYLALDELALVDDWQALYPGSEVSAGILDLFLSFVKPRTYQYRRRQSEKAAATVTNLMDTRNLQAGKVTFLNLAEGELPSGRTPVWLFNERQRQLIGMKNWDDIRSWERYYFYRLLAGAREVEIYTVASQDKDIEPSSFLSELLLFANQSEQAKPVELEELSVPADALLKNWLPDSKAGVLSEHTPLEEALDPAFFNLPCDPVSDFGREKRLNLSWTACERFLNNPFLFYLQDLKKLRERITRLPETMGRKMFGILLHKYLNVINQRLAEQHAGVLSMKWEWISREFLANNLKSALAQPLLFYQIPKNYNWEYLKALLSPFLVDTASWFFQVGLARDGDLISQRIRLIPETETSSQAEREYKLLIPPGQTESGISLAIRGRADLRLETKTRRFIIDFKTGGADKMQLLFYKLFYYLIEQPELEGSLRSAFYMLMDKQLQWLEQTTRAVPEDLVRKLEASLLSLADKGYAPATDSRNRRFFTDITRADLLRNLPLAEEEQ